MTRYREITLLEEYTDLRTSVNIVHAPRMI